MRVPSSRAFQPLDLWVQHWRTQQAAGEVIVVRYADDAVLGFQPMWLANHAVQTTRGNLPGKLLFIGLDLKNIDKPIVWVFPELVVCLDCGIAEFAVPEAQIPQ